MALISLNNKPIIHFAHANGFPAKTYRKLFKSLEPHYQIGYLDVHGHDPHYPVTENWVNLATELRHTIEQRYKQPVIGVGHSLGGVLSFLAATQRPELFQAIILLDSPILGKLRSQAIKLSKRLGLIDKITPAERTKRRRNLWPDEASALKYFKNKELFKQFDPDCLHDYIRYGMIKTAEGLRLKFKRDIEYQVYRTLPYDLAQYRKLHKVPTGILYGKQSTVVRPSDLRVMRKHFHMQAFSVPGTHMFPFECPEIAANVINEVCVHLT